MLFSAWFLSLEYTSYALEERGVLFAEQRSMMKNVRFGALCFGGLIMFSMAIPLFNIIVPPAAVIGATIFLLEESES